MKNRRTILVTFLLLAVMVMGVAYAALTDNLLIKGEATVNTTASQTNFDEDIYFSAASKVGAVENDVDSASISTLDNGDTINFVVKSLGNQGDSVTFACTIKNKSTEFDAKVTLDNGKETVLPDDTNFDCTYSTVAPGAEGYANKGEIIVPANDETIVYVTVTLKNSPQENLTGTFNVNLPATSQTKASN